MQHSCPSTMASCLDDEVSWPWCSAWRYRLRPRCRQSINRIVLLQALGKIHSYAVASSIFHATWEVLSVSPQMSWKATRTYLMREPAHSLWCHYWWVRPMELLYCLSWNRRLISEDIGHTRVKTTIKRITGHLDETTLDCLPTLVRRGFYRLRREDGGKENGGKEDGRERIGRGEQMEGKGWRENNGRDRLEGKKVAGKYIFFND